MKKIVKYLWYIIHNAVAHPLLIFPFRWAGQFHDWTASKMGDVDDVVDDAVDSDPMRDIATEDATEEYYRSLVSSGKIQGFSIHTTPDPQIKVIICAINKGGAPIVEVRRVCNYPCGPSDFCEGGMCDRKGCYSKQDVYCHN